MATDGGNDTEQEEDGVSRDVLNIFAMCELTSFRFPQKSLRRQTNLHPRSEPPATLEKKILLPKRSVPLPRVKLLFQLQTPRRSQLLATNQAVIQ